MNRLFCLSAFLSLLCFSHIARADEPATNPPTTRPGVHQTIERAIGYLQTESGAWMSQRKCAACHHAALPLWALSEADRRGYPVDKKYLAQTFEATLGSQG